jgi:hypothetical protein
MLNEEMWIIILSEVKVAWDVLLLIFNLSFDILHVFGGAALPFHMKLVACGDLDVHVGGVDQLKVLGVV